MRIFSALLFCMLPLHLFAQHAPFNEIYNYSKNYKSYSKTSKISSASLCQKNFIVAGTAYDDSAVDNSGFIAGMDYNGHFLWQRNFAFAGLYNWIDKPFLLTKIDSNRLVVAGVVLTPYTRPQMPLLYQPYINISNTNGDSLHFNLLFDSLESRFFYTVCTSSDKKIFAAGPTFLTKATYDSIARALVPDSSALYVVKFDTTGKKIWERRLFHVLRNMAYDTSGNDISPVHMLPTSDGGVVIGGDAHLPFMIRLDNFLMKLDSSGNVVWAKHYGVNNYLNWQGFDFCTAKGGGYYFVADMATQAPTTKRPFNSILLYGRLNNNGDTVWTKQFAQPGNNGGYANTLSKLIVQDSNGRLLILVNAEVDNPPYPQTVIRADSNGKILSYRQYTYIDSPTTYGEFWTLDVTAQNNILMSGYFNNSDSTVYDSVGYYGWIMQTDSLGCLVPGCARADTIWQHLGVNGVSPVSEKYLLYPNPTKGYCLIRGSSNVDGLLQLMDVSGRLLQEKKLSLSGTTIINMTELAPGFYIIKIIDKNQNFTIFKVSRE